MPRHRPDFGIADVAQQVVGGFLLAGPFIVTEEVWSLAAAMNPLQWALTVLFVVVIGFGALYQADEERDPGAEARDSPVGIPTRFLSLMLVSYGSVAVLALTVSAPEVFGADLVTTAKAVSIGALFAVVGASTADSVF